MIDTNMSSFNFVIILIVFYNFVSIVGGFREPLSFREARKVCNRNNKILSPSKSVQRNLVNHYRSIRSVWTSNYVLNLGCNSTTGFCSGLYIEQVLQNKTYHGLCQHDSSAFFSQTDASLQRNCRNGRLVDITNFATFRIAMDEMKWNTKYWINSISLSVDSFVVLCMIFTKFPNRTRNNGMLTFAACNGKYEFVCSEGYHYGTVVSKLIILKHYDFTSTINPSILSSDDERDINVNKTSVECIPKGDLVWKVSSLTLSGGIILIGLLVTCLRIMRTFGSLKKRSDKSQNEDLKSLYMMMTGFK